MAKVKVGLCWREAPGEEEVIAAAVAGLLAAEGWALPLAIACGCGGGVPSGMAPPIAADVGVALGLVVAAAPAAMLPGAVAPAATLAIEEGCLGAEATAAALRSISTIAVSALGIAHAACSAV